DHVKHSPDNIDVKPGFVEIFAFAEFCFGAFDGLLVYQCHDKRARPQHRANEHQTYDRGVKRRYEREHWMQMNQITSSNNAQGNNQSDNRENTNGTCQYSDCYYDYYQPSKRAVDAKQRNRR